MNIPLIPDLSNPKWLIIQQILKTIGSKRSQKMRADKNTKTSYFLKTCIKILVLADTFEKDYSYVISE